MELSITAEQIDQAHAIRAFLHTWRESGGVKFGPALGAKIARALEARPDGVDATVRVGRHEVVLKPQVALAIAILNKVVTESDQTLGLDHLPLVLSALDFIVTQLEARRVVHAQQPIEGSLRVQLSAKVTGLTVREHLAGFLWCLPCLGQTELSTTELEAALAAEGLDLRPVDAR